MELGGIPGSVQLTTEETKQKTSKQTNTVCLTQCVSSSKHNKEISQGALMRSEIQELVTIVLDCVFTTFITPCKAMMTVVNAISKLRY